MHLSVCLTNLMLAGSASWSVCVLLVSQPLPGLFCDFARGKSESEIQLFLTFTKHLLTHQIVFPIEVPSAVGVRFRYG